AKGPRAVGGARWDPQGLRCLLNRQSGKESESSQVRRGLVNLCQRRQLVVEGEEIIIRHIHREGNLVERNAAAPAAPFLSTLLAGTLDEDAAHGFRRSGKEVAAAVPGWLFTVTNEA